MIQGTAFQQHVTPVDACLVQIAPQIAGRAGRIVARDEAGTFWSRAGCFEEHRQAGIDSAVCRIDVRDRFSVDE